MKPALTTIAVLLSFVSIAHAGGDDDDAPHRNGYGVGIGLAKQGRALFRNEGVVRFYDHNGKPGLGARGPLSGSGSADGDWLLEDGAEIVKEREGTSAVLVKKRGAIATGKDFLIEERIVLKKSAFTTNNEPSRTDEVHANHPVGTDLVIGGRRVTVTHQDRRMKSTVARIIDKERATDQRDGLFIRTTYKRSAKVKAKVMPMKRVR